MVIITVLPSFCGNSTVCSFLSFLFSFLSGLGVKPSVAQGNVPGSFLRSEHWKYPGDHKRCQGFKTGLAACKENKKLTFSSSFFFY